MIETYGVVSEDLPAEREGAEREDGFSSSTEILDAAPTGRVLQGTKQMNVSYPPGMT